MKGKLKFKVGLIVLVATMIATIISLSIGTKSEKESFEKVFAVGTTATVSGEEFSARFDGDILLSVEKVSIGVGVNDNKYSIGNELYAETGKSKIFKRFQGNGGYYVSGELENSSDYYFSNIANGSSSKYVVKNGEFVMLNNTKDHSGDLTNGKNGYDVSDNSTKLQDAIMISLGQYIIKTSSGNEKVEIATESINAGITYLNLITATHNGNALPNLKLRTVNGEGGPFYDFVYVIPQIDGNEGFYQFQFEYMVNGSLYTGSFEFYLLFKSSYTQTIEYGEDVKVRYYAEPVMGWGQDNDSFVKSAEKNGFVRYEIGKSGIEENNVSFPTLTYDYTKYKAKIIHVSNRKQTVYEYDFNVDDVQKNSNGEAIYAPLNCKITNSDGTKTQTIELSKYSPKSSNNLISILFTEQGTYQFEFEYIYTGYNYQSAPEMNLLTNISSVKPLSIHGFELQYSKLNYTKAQFAHYAIAQAENHAVDLIVPFGVEESKVSDYKNQALGFTYEINANSSLRVGTILKNGTQNTLINSMLDNSEIENIKNLHFSEANSIISKIKFLKTNQGSMWFDQNDTFGDSFYLFTSTTDLEGNPVFDLVITIGAGSEAKTHSVYYRDEIIDGAVQPTRNYYYKVDGVETEITDVSKIEYKAQSFNNEVSFNKMGYYIICINIKYESNDFWQIFAFQYSTDTIDIDVRTDDATQTIIGAGRYTNKAVKVHWENPGRFEKAVTGYYYQIINNNASRDTLLMQSANIIAGNEIELGADVDDGQFVKYLVKVQNEGDSATYKMFTIDKSPITGVNAYAVQKYVEGNAVHYEVAGDKYGNSKALLNAITDSFATLNWTDKSSGATITATYTFTPFIQDSNLAKGTFEHGSGKEWVITDYKLGTTIGSFEFTKPISLNNLDSSSVKNGQGIYLFTLTDEAGNFCKYMFVIDSTRAYFKIWQDGEAPQYYSNEFLLVSEDVNYSVGDYKAFKLESVEKELNDFITALSNSNANELNTKLGYFWGDGSNYSALMDLFNKNGSDCYLTVKNEEMAIQIGTKSAIKTNLKGKIEYDANGRDGATSIQAKLFLKGANNLYSSKWTEYEDADSFMSIEINKDNSRGMVYFSDNQFDKVENFPTEGKSNETYVRLTTGTDNLKGDGSFDYGSGINGSYATSSKYSGFVWNLGSGIYEVGKIEYQFYSLRVSGDDRVETDIKYYEKSGSPLTVYENGTFKRGGKDNAGERGWFSFSEGSTQAQAGLYVVTRTYKNEVADFGDDNRVWNYYFIIDRNGIITDICGQNILINLLDTDFNNFSTVNVDSGKISIGDKNQNYNIYLKTTKLPATIQIPLAKYYTTAKLNSNYYAGQLKFKLYFTDLYNQYDKTTKTYTIFESEDVDADGIFKVNIYKYLTEKNILLRDKLIASSAYGDWISLPGRYVIEIKDNVIDVDGETHTKLIGFEIQKGEGPVVDVYSGFKQEELTKSDVKKLNDTSYSLTTSDEYVQIVLPDYKGNETNPQVDPDYLIVKQFYGSEMSTYYINYPYSSKSGYNITENKSEPTNYGVEKKIIEIKDATRYIYLDTMLRNANGVLNDLSKSLKYEITIRYKLNDAMKSNESEICYFYYSENGEKVYFHETTYEIIIDRVAPSKNIDQLIDNDKLVDYYNQENRTDTMFEHSAHALSNEWIFTYEYKMYYELKNSGTTDPSKIYALRVTSATEFSWDGLASVKYRAISDFSSLKFPIDEYSYNSAGNGVTTYGALLQGEECGYYEILERDEAGNTAQYIVCFTADGKDYLEIPINYMSTEGKIEMVNIGTSENLTITAFSIVGNGEAKTAYDDFYRLVIKNLNTQTEIGSINTNKVMIDDDELTKEVVKILQNAGKGNYLLTISSRNQDNQIVVNLYDNSEKPKLDIEKLIVQTGGIYQIVFANANIEKDGINYYAKEILISDGTQTYTFKCDPSRWYQYYTDEAGFATYQSSFQCLPDTTYTVSMTDVFGTKTSRSFNTAGKEFYSIEFEKVFEGSETELYYKLDDTYYTFTNVIINYDTTLFADKVSIDNLSKNVVVDADKGIITLKAIWDGICVGGLLDVNVVFEGDLGTAYHVVIDTTIGEVALRDYSTGDKKDIKVEKNIQNPTGCKVETTISGIMNLTWGSNENNYFDYSYTLFEHMEDESIKETSLNDLDNQVINTSSGSKGLYHFVINIYAKGTTVLLGNKVFTFNVQAKNNQLFYVQDSSNTAIIANSTLELSQLRSAVFNPVITESTPTSLIPLYVSNGALSVILTEDAKVEKTEYTLAGTSGYNFRLVKVKASIYEVWFGLLEVQKSNDITTGLKLVKSVKDIAGNETSYDYPILATDYSKTIVGDASDVISLKATKKNKDIYLLNKNNLFVDIYYNGEKVARKEFAEDINYEIRGNGNYSFVVSDLAGNVHKLNGIVVADGIDVSIMREVVVTVNGEAPIENAFYNGAVEVRIFASTKYETGSIKVKAFKNGTEITLSTSNPYTFEEYGTYRVEIEAKYDDLTDDKEPYTLRRTIVFTIVNMKEARQSIDLTALSSYKIEKILNPSGEDKTAYFKNNILNKGMLLTYERLMEETNRKGLNISAGKITFTLVYSVSDEIYPERKVEFKFTMSNEIPSIDCSLETGKSSTKGFDISFNAGIIYEQVGESFIYINDEIAYHITEESSFNLETISKTFKADGAGDYYIQLRSSSGNVLSSFKVTIKEPLNSWAIIIIVVVSVAIVTVVTVVIVLRRKMRIR